MWPRKLLCAKQHSAFIRAPRATQCDFRSRENRTWKSLFPSRILRAVPSSLLIFLNNALISRLSIFFYYSSRKRRKRSDAPRIKTRAVNCHFNYEGCWYNHMREYTRYWSLFRVIEAAAMTLREQRERHETILTNDRRQLNMTGVVACGPHQTFFPRFLC